MLLLARISHELLSRDRKDGRATGQFVPRYRGIGSEAYLNGMSQGPTPEDARKDAHIRGRSRGFKRYPGYLLFIQKLRLGQRMLPARISWRRQG